MSDLKLFKIMGGHESKVWSSFFLKRNQTSVNSQFELDYCS